MNISLSFADLISGAQRPPLEAGRQTRIEELFTGYERRIFSRTHQMFAWLLVLQWAFAITVAAIWSPRAWDGTVSEIHPHLLAAVFLGGILVLPPVLLIQRLPHEAVTRHAVGFAQVSFSALLIHLTGGRIETHFHVFGSLAFVAVYRDWRVLITATLVVAIDHLLRGIWYPVSVYGVPFATVWRTMEHALWVVFEDAVLLWACFVSRREMWEICRRDDQNNQFRDELEARVRERTAALEAEMRQHERTAGELGRSEERYRALVANMPIGIFETTRAGEVRVANPRLLDLLGLPRDQAIKALTLADGQIFPTAEREKFWAQLGTQGEVRNFAATFHRADGSAIDVIINARHKPATTTEPASCEGTIEDVTDRRRAARERDTLQHQLVIASRQAGMADVATGVLHNVGNVLTSVNITIHDLLDRLRHSRLSILHRVVERLQKEQHRLAAFFTEDPAGRQFPEFLAKLDGHLSEENARVCADVESLNRHFAHIREVIVTQQSSARLVGLMENLAPAQLFEDALKLSSDSIQRHGIVLRREFDDAPAVKADRHKVLQILVNLLKNAKDAVLAAKGPPPAIAVRVKPAAAGFVAFEVADNGLGIAPEHLARIFQHGFTTKKNGHGFGLHSCVLAAREMKGDLTLASEGVGRGATFTLTLPVA